MTKTEIAFWWMDAQVEAQSAVVYLALHKPVGVITTHSDPQGRPTVMELLPAFPGLLFVGRLDAESEGLLLATTDGRWGQRIQHPRYGCEKEYRVLVTGRLTPETLRRLRGPLDLGAGDRSSGAQVTVVERSDEGQTLTTPSAHHLRIVLREGRKRQIREDVSGRRSDGAAPRSRAGRQRGARRSRARRLATSYARRGGDGGGPVPRHSGVGRSLGPPMAPPLRRGDGAFPPRSQRGRVREGPGLRLPPQ